MPFDGRFSSDEISPGNEEENVKEDEVKEPEAVVSSEEAKPAEEALSAEGIFFTIDYSCVADCFALEQTVWRVHNQTRFDGMVRSYYMCMLIVLAAHS